MSKIAFSRQGLHDSIVKMHDQRVADLEQMLARLDDPERHREALEAWRKRESKRVLDLAKRIRNGSVEDGELDGFTVSSAPSGPRTYDRNTAARNLEHAIERRQRCLQRFEALTVRDEYEFTERQLSDFFGV